MDLLPAIVTTTHALPTEAQAQHNAAPTFRASDPPPRTHSFTLARSTTCAYPLSPLCLSPPLQADESEESEQSDDDEPEPPAPPPVEPEAKPAMKRALSKKEKKEQDAEEAAAFEAELAAAMGELGIDASTTVDAEGGAGDSSGSKKAKKA